METGVTPPAEPAETELDWRRSVRQAAPQLIIGALLGGLAFWLAFRGAEWGAVQAALAQVNYAWVGIALLSIAVTLVILTWRWRLLFYPDHRGRGWSSLFSAIVIGQMLNIIIPARLGEVVRAYVVRSREKLGGARVLVTIGLEKVFDLGAFAISVIVLLFSMSLPLWLQESGWVLIATGVAALLGTLAFSLWGRRWLVWLEPFAERLPAWLGRRLARYGHQALDGLGAFNNWRMQLGVWVISLVILVLSVSTNYLLFLAFRLPLSPIAALFVLVVLQVGSAPPSLPGKLGVFHYLTVLALAPFAVDASVALSYAFMLYAVAILPKILLGVVLFAVWRFRDGRRVALPWS